MHTSFPASGLISYNNAPKPLNPPTQRSVMATKAHRKDPRPTELLTLPDELLLEIVSLLCFSDLKRLSNANRTLHLFIDDYLGRYRYNVGLVALPKELILRIVQHLGRHKDRASFARASQRFYLLITDYTYRHNVQYGGSSLLNFAAKGNFMGMARMILYLGGDVNTQHGFRPSRISKRLTPLANAAFYGHERMVKMLLEAGASHFVEGIRIPLGVAIYERHENVALILSQDLDAGENPFKKAETTVLQMACMAKLVNLVQYYLERASRCGGLVDADSLHDRSISLYHVLQKDARKGYFVKRALHEDVYQIVLRLLQHGANPNSRIGDGLTLPATARTFSRFHPDPRVRALLSWAIPTTEPEESALLIGRPWMVPPKNKAILYEPQSEASSSENSRYALLGDFLELPNSETPTMMDEDEIEYRGTNYEDCRLNASDIADLVESGMQGLKIKSEPMEPPPLSSFPQLGIPKASAQHAAKDFWAKYRPNLPRV